jgi:hypothetical protein
MPALLKALALQPMSDPQAWAFRAELKTILEQKNCGALDRAA